MRVVGLDHSLTSTGVAFAAAAPGEARASIEWLRTIRTTSPPKTGDPLETRMDRIGFIARRFSDHMDDVADHPAGGPILLVIETRDWSAKSRSQGAPVDRAALWAQLMITARVYGAHLVGVAPPTLKVYACGNGHAGKIEVQDAVEQLYGVRCHNDDEADALTLAAMGCDRFGFPIIDLGEQHRRTIGRPVWPNIPGYAARR